MTGSDPAQNRELLDAVERGSFEAAAELLQRLEPRLLARIRLMLGPGAGSRAEEGDFLQDVYLEVARSSSRKHFRTEEDFLRFVCSVARNNIRDAGRKRREQRFADLTTRMLPPGDGPSSNPGPATQAAAHDDVNRLLDALESMAETDREVIALRSLEGLSFREIGERLGKTENATQLLHARALTRLSQILVPADDG